VKKNPLYIVATVFSTLNVLSIAREKVLD